ncbi:MAG: thioredoxin family protein [Planctomycetes bacterium]|nr:thioredoxin family protein [Planctomycetota bacterium]
MESTTPEAAPAPDGRPRALAAGLGFVCLVQVVLAWLALEVAEGAATCPDLGHGLGCAAVFRPRLSRLLGPVTVTHVAFVGSMAALGLALMLHARRAPPRPLLAAGLVALGAGAGFALGLQPLPLRAAGAACALCLGLLGCVLVAFALLLAIAWRAGVRARLGLAPLVVVAAALAPLAVRHGDRVAADDVERVARARAAGGAEGPRVLLVTQDGCPYCHALLADVLGDEQVVRVLLRTRGLVEVKKGDPRVPADPRGGTTRAPTVVVVGDDGRERGRLVGYSSDPATYATRLLTIVAAPADAR